MTRRNLNDKQFYLYDFKIFMIETDKSTRTVETYLENVKAFLDFSFNQEGSPESVAAITSIDVIEYRSFCMSKNNSVQTINLRLSSLNAYFGFLITKGIITNTPMQSIKKLKSNNVSSFSKRTFDLHTFKAIRRLFYREMNPLHICIFELLAKTGLRASELCNLKTSDFGHQIFDPNARSGKVSLVGKGNRYREIPLNSEVRNAIREWINLKEKKGIISEYLLVSERRTKFTTGGLRAIIRHYHKRVPGCEKYSLHSYRHYFATSLLRGDPPVDIVIISILMGHASVTTTRCYVNASYSDLEHAIEKISNC